MPSLPSPTDDYKAPPDLALSRAVWDFVLGSIGTRLRAVEGKSADFDALIALGTSQALEVISTNVEPQLAAMRAAVAALQADVDEAEDVITALITGSVPASAVAETVDRIWFTPALAAALAGKQAGDPTLTALAALTVAANKLIYATGADAFATTDLTAFARQLLDDADAGTMRETIGAADKGRTISTTGLATGGGDLSANRTITVPAATQAEAEAGEDNAKAMTALRVAQQTTARLASQAQAEGRTDATRLMTALRVAQQIDADPDLMIKLAGGSAAGSGYLHVDLAPHIAAGRRKFRVKIHNYRPVVDGMHLIMSGSTNGGASYPGAVYKTGRAYATTEGPEAVATGVGADNGAALVDGVSNGAGNEASGWVDIECGADHCDYTSQFFAYYAAGLGAGVQSGAGRIGLANVNYLRFETYTGNIASIAWTLYGVA